MKKILVIIFTLGISHNIFAQAGTTVELTPGAARLFKTNKSKLTNQEKNWLFSQLNLTLSTDKRLFKSGDYDVAAQAWVTDMNKDGVEEVFLVMQCQELFGDLGEAFQLYIKNSKGVFERQTEFGSGFIMLITSDNKKGYPDISLAGPGFEFPIYSWDGKKYKMSPKKLKNADLESKKVTYIDIAQANTDYLETIK